MHSVNGCCNPAYELSSRVQFRSRENLALERYHNRPHVPRYLREFERNLAALAHALEIAEPTIVDVELNLAIRPFY